MVANPSIYKNLCQKGFTLIELLMVVFIIGLSVGVVSLSFNLHDGESVLQDEAEEFVIASRFVAEHTVLAAEVVGLFISPEDTNAGPRWCYQWRRYRDESWRPIANFLEDQCLPASIDVEMIVEGEAYEYDPRLTAPTPVLVFYPSGESTPFEIAVFNRFDAEMIERIEIDMMSGVYWRSQDERNTLEAGFK